MFVNDGSRDRSAALLKTQFELRPEVTRVVLFSSNFGQHRAILAAFAHSRGRYVITLDADLQNPPEEIGRLLIELDAGHDYVGTIRIERQDVAWRRYASRLVNKIRERTTQVKITDQGSMFRGYARAVVDAVNQCSEYNTFVPALAYTFSMNPTEIRVAHEERGAGKSKYSLFSLMRLNFDLMTGFSSVRRCACSPGHRHRDRTAVGGGVRAVPGGAPSWWSAPRRKACSPLFAIAFFLIGVALFGVGLLGEYVGRIYDEVRHRPRYIVGTVLEQREDAGGASWKQAECRRAVVFAYHDVGVRCLRTLLAHGVDVPLVLTHADAAGENIWFESVAEHAAWHGIEVLTSETPNHPEMLERVRALHPEFLFSFYYRSLLGAELLSLPTRGAYNMHGSLLPKYRGRVPVNWAVLNGEQATGATLHAMVVRPDAAAI